MAFWLDDMDGARESSSNDLEIAVTQVLHHNLPESPYVYWPWYVCWGG